MEEKTLRELIAEQKEYLVDLRREFHAHPELSGQEVWTSGRICEELDKAGIPHVRVENYNVIGTFETGRPGRKLAIRADIDALPVQEQNQVPYCSKIPGVMHACGHDGHTAMLLGIARLLPRIKDRLCGTIYLCFQLGEELGLGAAQIVPYLKSIGGVDECISCHIGALAEMGQVLLPAGPFMAGSSGWTLTVHGRGGHGSMPEKAIDPIRPACEILLRYTSIPSNRITACQPVVMSPCKFQSGTAGNIIPDTATIQGTIRYFDLETAHEVHRLMKEIADDVAASYGATAELDMTHFGTPVINNVQSAQRARDLLKEIDGLELAEDHLLMGSDDYGLFLADYPGFYCFIGSNNPKKGITADQHNACFNVDEDILPLGCEFLLTYACRSNAREK